MGSTRCCSQRDDRCQPSTGSPSGDPARAKIVTARVLVSEVVAMVDGSEAAEPVVVMV